ncbi:MAG: hypothetical protein NZ990_12120 [Myxococcota bacterium]|nr:hypothetical protein [Myxococcota bacterium]
MMNSGWTTRSRAQRGAARRLGAALLILPALVIVPRSALPQQDAGEDRMLGLLSFLGFSPGAATALDAKPKVVELEVLNKSRQASFAGMVRLPDADAGLFRESDSPPPFIKPSQVGYFSQPARSDDLASLELAQDDYEVLAECKPAKCRFKLDMRGIEEAESIDWKAPGAHADFLDWFRIFLVRSVAAYRSQGIAGLISYADKKAPYPVARGVRSLQEAARPVLSRYPAMRAALAGAPEIPPAAGLVSDRMLWSVSDFGYRPTLSVDRVIISKGDGEPGLGGSMAIQNIYANHYLAGRLQVGGVLRLRDQAGQSAEFFWLLDQILFDDELGGLKRSLLARGLKSEVEARLAEIRSQGASLP